MTRLPARTQVKRDAIHAAATALFLRLGFEGTSMDAIAADAGVSKQTLYRYYQSKETLFVAVLSQLALHHLDDPAWHSLRNMPVDSLPQLQRTLTLWAQEMIQHLMQPAYLGLLRLLIAELPRFPHLSTLFTQAIPEQGGAFLKDVLLSARSHGIIKADDEAAMIRLLVGPLLTYVLGSGLFAPESRPQVPSPEQVAVMVRLALVGIATHEKEQDGNGIV